MVDHLTSQDRLPTREVLFNDLLSLMACHAAVRAGDRLDAGGDGRPAGAAPPGRRPPPLPARPADGAAVQQARPRTAVPAGVNADQRSQPAVAEIGAAGCSFVNKGLEYRPAAWSFGHCPTCQQDVVVRLEEVFEVWYLNGLIPLTRSLTGQRARCDFCDRAVGEVIDWDGVPCGTGRRPKGYPHYGANSEARWCQEYPAFVRCTVAFAPLVRGRSVRRTPAGVDPARDGGGARPGWWSAFLWLSGCSRTSSFRHRGTNSGSSSPAPSSAGSAGSTRGAFTEFLILCATARYAKIEARPSEFWSRPVPRRRTLRVVQQPHPQGSERSL